MDDSASIIQLALAPVFLLVAIGTLLNVVSARLARVIDRSRLLTQELATGAGWQPASEKRKELGPLRRRMRAANAATNFLAAAAVCVCIVVALLFVQGLVQRDLDVVITGLFMLTMLLITGGVVSFLIEVTVATATVKVSCEVVHPPNDE
jgi:hypothetical protein